MEYSLEIRDIITVAAIILGPILAVQIQKMLEHRQNKHARKLDVFRDLMRTRADPLDPVHVSALNMVGLEFDEKKDLEVVTAWTTYIDHLSSYPDDDQNKHGIRVWADKAKDQLSDLLYEMSQSLGFRFDKVHIKRAGYAPQAYLIREEEIKFIRRRFVDILLGNGSLPISLDTSETAKPEK